MINSVNYNEISPVYNTRYQDSPLEGVLKYLTELVNIHSPKNILELGCGTAHWLNELSKYRCHLFGGDYSIGMLKEAANSNSTLNLFNADANNIPLKHNTFDLVICINAIHHFKDKKKFVEDAISLLNKNGIITIIGLDPCESENEWYLYKYFDRTYKIDLERFPAFENIKLWMQDNRLVNIEHKLVHRVISSKSGREVLSDHFLDKRGASQLALLTEEEYKKGLSKIKFDIDLAEKENRKIDFVVKLSFYAIAGMKP
ncbi:MAG: class I SAM-dependent methyltransferase [Melioribacteraceae bacterium]|nr:class I SAM-dependent methyltransferase [Melioribacteraceae bacterium]